MSILSEGSNFGIKKPKGTHLDHCKSCGGGWKYTFYVDQTSPEVRSVLKSRGYKDYDSVCPECIKSIEELRVESAASLNEWKVNRSPAKFREWAYEDVSGEMMMLFDEMNVPGPDRDKYYEYMESAEGRAFLKNLYDEWTDEETAAEKFIEFCKDQFNQVKEDFSMGVGGPTGLNQGIPHGGPGKGVLPKPLYDPKVKAVPPKKKGDEDTEENLKKLRAAKKLLRNEGYVIVRRD